MRSLTGNFAGMAVLVALAGVLPLLGQSAPEGSAPEESAPAVQRNVIYVQQGAAPPPPQGASNFYLFTGGDPGAPPPGTPGEPKGLSTGPMISFVSAVGGFGRNTVTGAPYSAQAVTEIEQRLADGNRISRKMTATVYRDSEGRTRRDQTLGAIGPWVVSEDLPQISSIYDPVAKVGYMLDHTHRTARKLPALPMPPSASGLPEKISRRVRTEVASGLAQAAGEVEAGEPFDLPVPPPPGIGFRAEFSGSASLPEPHTESLGTQTIEGVEAEGTRTISTIPAGAIGNDFAIEIVSERWYSPELQTVVLSLHKDPRMGETTYRLTGIDRSEPSPSLFEVPEGYTVIEPRTRALPPPGPPAQ